MFIYSPNIYWVSTVSDTLLGFQYIKIKKKNRGDLMSSQVMKRPTYNKQLYVYYYTPIIIHI